ncbi:cytochrome c oxidase subunit II [Methylomicrobium sp. Wu6]|uniref:cytochrome c oxidase subunit II n=1 Tax=Methylomicrobium sp. Wu6 TaxID=3107928 RepID=UPI002DD63F60|nr:cytochrome c oxidase subunit II [Methylomicrobium sp. Wu6]MEC4748886.1 cytochrome c oxidase subunit II [Methylomicrobium sp. Wu6]
MLSSAAEAETEAAPLNYFLHSYGPASTPTMYLGWVFAAIAVAVFLIIALLLAGALFRKRAVDEPASIGRDNQGMRWIYIGTGVSTCILFALAVYVLITLNTISRPARTPALTVTVTGYDWWWKVEYEDNDPARRFVTANEIHIPIGLPVLVKLKSADVIHAFWVPMLAGKTQMIPGQANEQWLEAEVEGIYRGQCTQYCGLQHAHMGFEVVAQSPADFRAWQDEQRRAVIPASAADAVAGQHFFIERCAGCHSVRGIGAAGAHAPDLTHLNSRRLIAAGLLTNTPEHQVEWIMHVQKLKPGDRMPGFELSSSEIAALSAFLSTLN